MKRFSLLILCLILSGNIFSNGGPILNSLVIKTGQVQLINENNIVISDEKINLKIEGEYAIYDITYTFVREMAYLGDTIWYGFSVDYGGNYVGNEEKFRETDVPYFEMYFNNKPLDVKEQYDYGFYTDTILIKKDTSTEYPFNFGKSVTVQHKKKWYISKLYFEKGSCNCTLNIKYKVRAYAYDLLAAKFPFVYYEKRKLVYDLSPAGYWGKGVISNLTVNIDISNLDSNFEEYQIKGLEGCVLNNSIYTFQAKNFEPKKNKIFLIEYTQDVVGKTTDYKMDYVRQKYVQDVNSSLNGSLTNLNDFKVATTFDFEKPNNQNEYIEYTFAKWGNFLGISILNGDYSSEENYYKKGRLKKIRLEYQYRSYMLDTGMILLKDTIITLEDKKYLPVTDTNFSKNCDYIDAKLICFDRVKRLKITFLEYYDGKGSDRVGISELILNGTRRWSNEYEW
jgi:hypothetical protein